jgi:hypothetical protein
VEQAFMPAVKLLNDSALAAEVLSPKIKNDSGGNLRDPL